MSRRDANRQFDPIEFGCLDRQRDIDIAVGDLPHWFQQGSAIFVTFRTADSMPPEVVLRWQTELEDWLKQHCLPVGLGKPPNLRSTQTTSPETRLKDQLSLASIPGHLKQEFQKLRQQAWHRSLDECHGKCLLKEPALARIVSEAILHFEGSKYDLDCFMVMPNHVHAIVQFRDEESFQVVSQSWLRYTARQINSVIGDSGEFWQNEPFDHVIRNGNQFEYLQGYVADNARKASLRDGEFLYWQR